MALCDPHATRFAGFRRDVVNNTGDTLGLVNLYTQFSPLDPNKTRTRKGYTGHEMVDGAGIVHMGGRIYDPMLGRFLQADPIIQDPLNSQSHNRYTYVFNNPLSLTDPSGYRSLSANIERYWRPVVTVAIMIATRMYIGLETTTVASAQYATMAAGATSGYVSSGSLRGAVMGAIDAIFTMGIADLLPANTFGDDLFMKNLAAHSLKGGFLAELNGGDFGHGFATAAFSKVVGVLAEESGLHWTAGTVVSAVGGGLASKATGGKFANGAVSAAMQFLFNQVGEKADEKALDKIDDKVLAAYARRAGLSANEMRKALGFGLEVLSEYYNDPRARVGEFGGFIYRKDGELFVSKVKYNAGESVSPFEAAELMELRDSGGEVLFEFHTHPDPGPGFVSNFFSPKDIRELNNSSKLTAIMPKYLGSLLAAEGKAYFFGVGWLSNERITIPAIRNLQMFIGEVGK